MTGEMAGASNALRKTLSLVLASAMAGLFGFGGAAPAVSQPSLREALQDRDEASRRVTAPVVARYEIDDGQGFILDRSSSQPLLKFENSSEVWVLQAVPGPRGDIIYKNDLGQPMLRATKVGGLILFTPQRPAGSAAALTGGTTPIGILVPVGPSILLRRLAQASVRVSRAAQHLVPMEADFDPSSASLIADAAVICAEAFVRLAARSDGRALMGQVGKIGFIEGQRPAVSLVNGVMMITVAPNLGMAGRPSSDRIIYTVVRGRGPPPPRR